MQLFLCRHGEASYDAVSDRLRPLTNHGLQATQRVVESAQDPLASISRIWVSDLLRAQQTADLFSQVLKIKPEIQHFLRPDSRPVKLIEKLSSSAPSDGAILVVSHMPFLGEVVSELCHGHPYEPHPFVTSELVRLEGDVIAAGLCSITAQFYPAQ